MLKGIFALFSGNLFAKIVGVGREVLLSYLYGTGAVLGAFRVSQSAALVSVNFFTSDTLNSGFIPLYKEYKSSSEEEASKFFWTIHTLLTIASVFILVLLIFFAEYLVGFIAPGLVKDDLVLAATFLQVLAISIPFYVLSALYANLALANGLYRLISVRPLLQSLGLMLGAFISYYADNIWYLAAGFTIAYVCFYLYCAFHIWHKKYILLTNFLNLSLLTRFFKVIRPLLPLPIFLQGTIVVEKLVASYLGIEVIASLEFAKFITETGMVLIAIPIGYVGLSAFSSLSKSQTAQILRLIIPILIILCIPASCFLYIYSEFIVSILFERGAFDKNSVELTAQILRGLSIGFWAQVISYVLIKAMNSNMKNLLVMYFMIAALLLNAIVNITMYKFMGAVVLGISVSCYGLLLLALTITYYNLWKECITILIPMLIITFIYYLLHTYMLVQYSQIVNIIVFVAYWSLWLVFMPAFRATLLTVYQDK